MSRRRNGRGSGFLVALSVAAVVFALVSVLVHDRRQKRPGEVPSSWNTLAAWNNEMIRAHGRGDLTNAMEIAQRILSQREWRAFVPANAVMGSVLAQAGDYAAAERFFRVAISGKGLAAPQPVVLNDYADTLCHLGRYAEAEIFARRAVAASGGQVQLFKQTLDQILSAVGKDADGQNTKENET